MNMLYPFIAVSMILYSIVAGLFVPLKPGVIQLSPSVVELQDTVALTATIYNGNFKDQCDCTARLRFNDTIAIEAQSIEVMSPDQLTMNFVFDSPNVPLSISSDLSKKSAFPFLEIFDEQQGYISLESAIYLKGIDTSQQEATGLVHAKTYPETSHITYPYLNILMETIRNLFFHVPMWFGMLVILFISFVNSIRYLSKPQELYFDHRSQSLAKVGLLYGIIGIVTGAVWAKHTWGAYWSFDVKQNTSAIALLIYMAYFVLRQSFDDPTRKAKISAVYNIFAFSALIPLLYIIPRMVDSLHPGATGNPGFNTYDLDNTMRLVFYPAVIGWIMFGFWLARVDCRITQAEHEQYLEES